MELRLEMYGIWRLRTDAKGHDARSPIEGSPLKFGKSLGIAVTGEIGNAWKEG